MPPSTGRPGPIPSSVTALIVVRFVPRLRGATPTARSPRGERAYIRTGPRWLPVSSTNTKRVGATPSVRSRQVSR
jgi:hypothetical protein